MGIRVTWDDDARTIINLQFDGHWTLHDFQVARDQAFAMVRSVQYPVHVVVHLQGSPCIPDGIFYELRRALVTAPQNRGLIVLVGRNALVKTATFLFQQFFCHLSSALHVVETPEEARALLAMAYARQT